MTVKVIRVVGNVVKVVMAGPQGPTGPIGGVANIGTGSGQIFKQVSANTAQLRRLLQGTNITITQVGDDIRFDAAGSGTTGEAEIDFGATPTNEGSVVVTGQTGITQSASIQTSFPAKATTNNTITDSEFASIALRLSAGNIVDNVGFTIKAFCTIGQVTGKFKISYRW